MDRNEIVKLLARYNSGNCSEKEKSIIESWYLQYEDSSTVNLKEEDRINDLQSIFNSLPIHDTKAPRVFSLYRIAAAVAAIFILTLGTYFYTLEDPKPQVAQKDDHKIIPGSTKATLILSDGSKIILDDVKEGVLAQQAGVSIQKTSDGQLIYSVSDIASSSKKQTEEVYNTIETPAGGSYQVNLPDGSKVWLNAASSLRFPAKFTGGSRKVILTGEAYFEIAKNKNMPFKVISNDQTVEVLGTHFNINAYPDEAISKTTLLEGSIKLIHDNRSVLLNPGQQAFPGHSGIQVIDADVEEILAWKNGYFLFRNEEIQSIMRKISRWYNVEVTYRGNISTLGFGGKISRSKNIDQVLKVLQLTNRIHFKIEGRRIVVMP